jgi:hypothetical protein
MTAVDKSTGAARGWVLLSRCEQPSVLLFRLRQDDDIVSMFHSVVSDVEGMIEEQELSDWSCPCAEDAVSQALVCWLRSLDQPCGQSSASSSTSAASSSPPAQRMVLTSVNELMNKAMMAESARHTRCTPLPFNGMYVEAFAREHQLAVAELLAAIESMPLYRMIEQALSRPPCCTRTDSTGSSTSAVTEEGKSSCGPGGEERAGTGNGGQRGQMDNEQQQKLRSLLTSCTEQKEGDCGNDAAAETASLSKLKAAACGGDGDCDGIPLVQAEHYLCVLILLFPPTGWTRAGQFGEMMSELTRLDALPDVVLNEVDGLRTMLGHLAACGSGGTEGKSACCGSPN